MDNGVGSAGRDPTGRRSITLLAMACAAAIGIGIVLSAVQRTPVWLLLAVAVAVLDVALFAWSRTRANDTRIGRPTGATVTRVAPPAFRMRTWTGGVNVPGGLGRFNATAPFGVLELNGPMVTLRVRPTFMARFFGARLPFSAQPDDGVEVFPARGLLRWGIGFHSRAAPVLYFWTFSRGAILAALEAASFAVSWEERRMRY